MNIIETILKEEPFLGEDGKLYVNVTKEIKTPRKTFVRGNIKGKYRGDLILSDEQLYNSSLYDFEIYEAQVYCCHPQDFQKNKPFKIGDKSIFPKEKLPQIILVELNANNRSFGINILEPQLYDFKPIAKWHQTEGDEIFGCFKGLITGYVLDYEKEIVTETKGPFEEEEELVVEEQEEIMPCESSGTKTGKFERTGDYIRYEYVCRHHGDTVWGEKKYQRWGNTGTIKNTNVFGNRKTANVGCFSEIFSIIAIVFGLIFIISILPGALYFIGIYLAILLLNVIAPFLKWVFRIVGIVLLLGFVTVLGSIFSNRSTSYIPSPVTIDSPRETSPEMEPIVDVDIPDTSKDNNTVTTDSIIKRYRVWKDYEGNRYEGTYQLKLSDYKKASFYKRNLQSTGSDRRSYDEIVYSLKQNDKDKLNGLYQLFDSIGNANSLNKIKFAEMVVAFVQDIPYALVLEDDCNPSLYNDPFIRKYLSSKDAVCISFQRFGINTPVEFLVNLKGDCDTRTLLLYTILAHYDYDVALMSSEQYSHSILGVNLPLEGLAYKTVNQKYVLWETTAPNAKPGMIPNEIANLNNWRISLKSK